MLKIYTKKTSLYADLTGSESLTISMQNPYQHFFEQGDGTYSYTFDVPATPNNEKIFSSGNYELCLVTDFHNFEDGVEKTGNAIVLDRFRSTILERDFDQKKMKIALYRTAILTESDASCNNLTESVTCGTDYGYSGARGGAYVNRRLTGVNIGYDPEHTQSTWERRLKLHIGNKTIESVLQYFSLSDFSCKEPIYNTFQGYNNQTNGVPSLAGVRSTRPAYRTTDPYAHDVWKRGCRLYSLRLSLKDVLHILFGRIPDKFKDDERFVVFPVDLKHFKLNGTIRISYANNLISGMTYIPKYFPACTSTIQAGEETGRTDGIVSSAFAKHFPFSVSKDDIRGNSASYNYNNTEYYIEDSFDATNRYKMPPLLELGQDKSIAQLNGTSGLTLEFDIDEEIDMIGELEDVVGVMT